MQQHSLLVRVWRWALSGGICTLLQLLLAWVLSSYVSVFWSSFLAYSIAGQVNFTLHSVFTWSDRHPNIPFGLLWFKIVGWRWCKFIMVNISASALNGSVQWLIYDLSGHRPLAFVLANAVSAPYNLLIMDKVVFKHDDPPTELVERNE